MKTKLNIWKKALFFVVLLLAVVGGAKAESEAQAIWCSGNHTLYFVNMELQTVGSTFDGQTITNVWSGSAVTNTGELPAWFSTVNGQVRTVRFATSFKDVKPVTLKKWFDFYTNLSTIEGIENLNTSEVTSMASMFTLCSGLKTIDISTFDMSKVTDVSGMFTACTNLNTIYCTQTWTGIAKSDMMFYNTKLKGYVKDSSPDDLSMANPFTGYFSLKPEMTGTGTKDNPFVFTDAAHWDALSNYVATGKSCSGLFFMLGTDLEVKTRIGADGKPFNGTFFGDNHQLTVNIDGGTDDFAAPFAYVENATIQGFNVVGTVKGGIHSAGLVGSIVGGTNTITGCRVSATITTSDQYAGGIVGHGHSATVVVEGCLFDGTVTRGKSGGRYAGAIMGWCDKKDKISILRCVENGIYTNFSNSSMNYCYNGGTTVAFCGSDCYNFHTWTVCKQALEITLDDDDVLKPVGDEYSYDASTIVCYKGGAMSYLPDIEDIDDLLVFAAKGDTFSFQLMSGTFISVKDEDDNVISCSGKGTEAEPYSFTMPGKPVTVNAKEGWAYVLKIGSDKLVFAYSEKTVKVGDKWNGETINNLWSGSAVEKTGWSTPGWLTENNKDYVTTVAFDPTFVKVRPQSLFMWFANFKKLATIEGIEYLNTSECTNMNSTFFGCEALHEINVNGFDVSKVTNATTMFRSCSVLTTIYCDQAWDIKTADAMFKDCKELKNVAKGIKYDESKTGCSMATPDTGYFTASGEGTITGSGTESNPYIIGTAAQWNTFARNVNNGNKYLGEYVKLNADINIGKTMVGTVTIDASGTITGGNYFGGYFDGDGHTITMALEGGSGERCVAPFRYVDGKISNLAVSGTISTSDKFAGSIVGVATYIDMTNCRSDVAMTSTVNGDGTHGGFVGLMCNPNYVTVGYRFSIDGCLFNGKLLGANTTNCGGFVGWVNINGVALTISNSLFAPAETTLKTSGCQTFVRSGGATEGASRYAHVEDCYYTAPLGSAQGVKVMTITDESGTVMPANSRYYDVSNMSIGSNMVQLFIVEEVSDDGVEGSYTNLGAIGQTVKFTTSVAMTATDADNKSIALSGNGSDKTPYSFTMPAKAVTLTASGAQPYVLWCANNQTLYFVALDWANVEPGVHKWDGEDNTITAVWSGDDVVKTGWGIPKWTDTAKSAQRVVFDPSFKDVLPNSLFKWFAYFNNLRTIEGMENLNTSEVTTMNAAFAGCDVLQTIDLNGFNVSKLTNTTTMFSGCSNLTTIYCSNTWNVKVSIDMFVGCYSLVGAVKYNSDKRNAEMANPYSGYFTKKMVTLYANADNTATIATNTGISNMEVTLNGLTYSMDGEWNAVCLPFALNGETFLASPFISAIEIRELDTETSGYDAEADVLRLHFQNVFFDDDTTDDEYYGEGMVAGVPYLVRWAKPLDYEGNESAYDIVNPVFAGVTIDATAQGAVVTKDGKASFIGSYVPVQFSADDTTFKHFADDSQIGIDKSGMKVLPALNGYIKIDESLKHLNDVQSDNDGNITFSRIEEIQLKDGEDNSSVLASFDGQRVNVNYDRVLSATLRADGTYASRAYTVCLPYDLSLYDFDKDPEENNVRVYIMEGIYSTPSKYEFVFAFHTSKLEAGMPYLVVVDRGTVSLNAENVSLISKAKEGVPIYEWDAQAMPTEKLMGYWKGTLQKIESADAAAMYAYSLQSDGSFRRIRPDTPWAWWGAFRSMFCAYAPEGADPKVSPIGSNRFEIGYMPHNGAGDTPFGSMIFPSDGYEGDCDIPDESVGISPVIRTIDGDGTENYYDLQGRKIENRKSQSGIYIHNGKKMMSH